MKQFDEDRRVLFPSYYHVVTPNARPHSTKKRWRISFSVGIEFDPYGVVQESRPIFFVVFSDNDTDERIARQPISVGSLLETTATWSEIRTSLGIISEMPSEQQLVDGIIFGKERDRALYDEHLTMYSGPVHLMSFFTKDSDPFVAYSRAALLANIALNVSDVQFDRLVIPPFFDAFISRASAFIANRDRGFLFAVLASHATGADDTQPLSVWLDALLERSGLTNLEVIRYLAYQQMEYTGRNLARRQPLDDTLDLLLTLGRHRFLQNSAINTKDGLSIFDPLGDISGHLPDIYDSSGERFSLGCQEKQYIYDVDEMFLAEVDLCAFTDNFMQGCRGMSNLRDGRS